MPPLANPARRGAAPYDVELSLRIEGGGASITRLTGEEIRFITGQPFVAGQRFTDRLRFPALPGEANVVVRFVAQVVRVATCAERDPCYDVTARFIELEFDPLAAQGDES